MDSGFLIFPELFLEDCMFLGIYPFHPGCPICWHRVSHSIFLQSFLFLWCQLVLLLFDFWFYVFGSSVCFSLWVWLKVHQSCYFFREPALGLIDPFYFLNSLLFICTLIFIISFLLLALGFICCYFSSYLSLDCLFEIFLVFLEVSL